MNIGEKIRKLREDRNLSQKDFAHSLGISTGTIAEWESNESAPTIADISKICMVFGISADSLLMECKAITNGNISAESTFDEAKIASELKTKNNSKKVVIIAVLIIATILLGLVITALSLTVLNKNWREANDLYASAVAELNEKMPHLIYLL